MTAQSQIFLFFVPNKGNKIQVILRIGLLCILLGRKTEHKPFTDSSGAF